MLLVSRLRAVDVVFALALVVSAVVTEARSATAPHPWAELVAATWMGCLLLRTAAPLVMAVTASVGAVAYGLLPGAPETPFWAFLGMLVLSFSLGLNLEGRRRVGAAATTASAAIVLSLLTSTERDPADLFVAQVAMVVAPCLAGGLVRRSRRQSVELRRVGAALAAEREAHLRDVAAAERNRVAQEIHDVISHSVSEMVVQAGAAEQLLPPDSPVREQVQVVRRTGRDALAELRHQLGALRDGSPESATPMPGLADIAALAAEAGARLRDGGPSTAEVPPGTALTAYRVVQEALTNARRHAAGAPLEVCVTRQDDELVVEVRNGPGERLPEMPAGGHGLVGMRERIEVYAGRLDVGRTTDGGWRVRAALPLPSRIGAAGAAVAGRAEEP